MTPDAQNLPIYGDIRSDSENIQAGRSREYILNLLGTFIRDTPFRTIDLLHLHERVMEQNSQVGFSSNTVRREFQRMRNQGVVVDFDVHSANPVDRYYRWDPNAPQQNRSRSSVKNEAREEDPLKRWVLAQLRDMGMIRS
jgi:hypothetical protein